jgi:hypothetical protein
MRAKFKPKPILEGKALHCNPVSKKNANITGSCMPPEDLYKVISKYNMEHPNAPITPSNNPKMDYKKLLKATACKSEVCLANKPLDPELVGKHLRPKRPKNWKSNPHTWLNNFDIDALIAPYAKAYPDFAFLGVVPVDFSLTHAGSDRCISNDLCVFNIHEYFAQGKRRFGLIINLDKHTGPGTHWVALYWCIDPSLPFGAIYFDSGGNHLTRNPPPKIVVDFIKKVRKDILNLNISDDFPVFYNTKSYQKGNTECGMFSTIFLIKCVEINISTPLQYVKRDLDAADFRDERVWQYRKILFR